MDAFSKLMTCLSTACAVSIGSHATDRYYPDESVESPNGRYLLEAISPDNAEQNVPFADDFVYTLTDRTTGEVVWTREQGEREASPIEIFVDDSGWCAIWSGWHRLLLIDPETGNVAHSHSILDQVTPENTKLHVAGTTAGPMWSAFSRWYFLTFEGDLYFVLRPGWGRRQIVAVENGTLHIDGAAPDLISACEAEENEHALRALREAAETASEDPAEINEYETKTAMVIVAQNKVPDALPFLRQLEQLEFLELKKRDWIVEDYDAEKHNAHLKDFHAVTNFRFRVACRFAIRILGEQPKPIPSTLVVYRDTNRTRYLLTMPGHPEDRAQRAERAGSIRTSADALELLGPPDSLNYFWGRRWEYHIEAETPYTLSLSFDPRTGKIGIEKTEPALWQHPSAWIERLD